MTDGVVRKRVTVTGFHASVADLLERGGLLVLLGALIVFFSVDATTGPIFTSGPGIRNILGNQSVTAVIALATVVPLVAGYFDLSVAAVAGLSNVALAAATSTHHAPIAIGLLFGLLLGVVAGVINGFLVAGLRLNGFVVTLGTYTFIGGLLQWYTKGETITNVPQSLTSWGAGDWIGIPRAFWILIAVALLTWYLIMHTPWGRRLEGVGSNEAAARLVGVRVDRVVFMSFICSGLLAALAGAILAMRTGIAEPAAGPSYLFPALAAVFLGSTAIRPGRFNVWGTVVGVFLVAVAVNGLTLLGAETWVTPVFNGAALVLSVAVSTLMGRRREALAKAASAPPPTDADADVPGSVVEV